MLIILETSPQGFLDFRKIFGEFSSVGRFAMSDNDFGGTPTGTAFDVGQL